MKSIFCLTQLNSFWRSARVPFFAFLVISSQLLIASQSMATPDPDFNKFQLNKAELIHELRGLKTGMDDKNLLGKVLDSLIFYTDTHYKGGSNIRFLAQASRLIAKRESQNPDSVNPMLYRYFNDLSQVLERTQDTPMSAIVLLKSYFKFSSVEKPKDPKAFVTQADYSNGRDYHNVN